MAAFHRQNVRMRLTSPRVRLRSLVATGSDRDHTRVSALVSVLAAGASAAIALTAADAWRAASAHPAEFATLLVFAVALQLVPVSVYGRGSMTVSGIGILATGFTFGVGPAIAIAAICGLVHAVRMRLKLHKAIFNVATLALSAGAATLAFSLLGGPHWGSAGRIAPAVFAGACYAAVNTVVVAYAMSLSESRPLLAVWRERFRWLTAHYLAFGPLALASSIAYEEIGLVGLIAFVLPPALLVLSVRQYLDRTREAVEEVRRANEDLRYANAELAERNDDLHELFQFAAGLAARAADRKALVGYAESSLGRLAGGSARIALGDEERGIELFAGGSRVGTLDIRSSSGAEKWERLREAILPQLATALESAELVERVKSTHLATIAALSRSMEAKDYYTAGTPSASRTSRSRWRAGSATSTAISTRSRSGRSCTTSGRSGSPSGSSTSRARSTTRSGRS